MSRPQRTPDERKARKAAYMKAWKQANAAHVAAYDRTYQRAHRDTIRTQDRTRRAGNKETINATKRADRQVHPEKYQRWDQAKRDRINADPVKREAKLAYDRAYHQAHREIANALRKTRFHAAYHADLEATHAKDQAKRERQGEAYNAYLRAYYVRTISRRRALQRGANKRRRARLNAAPINNLTEAEWEQIKAHYGQRCVYCGRRMQRLEQDHIIPLSKGGSHTKQNVVPACRSCNAKKNAGPVLKPVQPLLL